MASIDYNEALNLLKDLFSEAEKYSQSDKTPPVKPNIINSANILFLSPTQSYREVLLGCGLAKLLDRSINIRNPYINQGDNAFNGRTLDERVINPFLQDRLIPSSKGPYLASFRRSVKFIPETAKGLRDKEGYASLLDIISALEAGSPDVVKLLVVYILYRFIQLRNASNIPLSQISRLSLEQYRALVGTLLLVQSGGLIPVLLVVAMLRTIKDCFSLPWEIEYQGINVSDKASGVGGDITVKHGKIIVLSIEVTERLIEKSRVVSTFNTKIVKSGIEDYLFVYSNLEPTEEALQASRKYFSQGHEINFLQIQEWIVNNLGTIGAKGRSVFNHELISLFNNRDVSATIKIAWNDTVRNIVEN